jgi:hypothetical protein
MPADGAGTHQTAATFRGRGERLAQLRETATARPQCPGSRRPSRRRTSRCSPRGPDVIAGPDWLTSHASRRSCCWCFRAAAPEAASADQVPRLATTQVSLPCVGAASAFRPRGSLRRDGAPALVRARLQALWRPNRRSASAAPRPSGSHRCGRFPADASSCRTRAGRRPSSRAESGPQQSGWLRGQESGAPRARRL